jgi:hypothetical protein
LMQLAKSEQPFQKTRVNLTAAQLTQLKNHEIAALDMRITQCQTLGVFADSAHAEQLSGLVRKEYNRRQGTDDEPGEEQENNDESVFPTSRNSASRPKEKRVDDDATVQFGTLDDTVRLDSLDANALPEFPVTMAIPRSTRA